MDSPTSFFESSIVPFFRKFTWTYGRFLYSIMTKHIPKLWIFAQVPDAVAELNGSSLKPRKLNFAVVGHRGAAGHAPENTIAAIRKAAELGVKSVEFDVKLTSDNKVILMHDDDLKRTTDGSGFVRLSTAAQIAQLDAGRKFSTSFSGERVPSLEEVLEELVQLKMHANIEIKPCPGREVETALATVEVIRRTWPVHLPPPLLSSFEPESLRAALEVAPEIPRGLLLSNMPRFEDLFQQLHSLQCATVHFNYRRLLFAPLVVKRCRSAGFPVLAYTVNSALAARILFAIGVSAVFTDYPDRLNRHL